MAVYKTVNNYVEVLKPLPTLLLTFIGVCTAIVAAGGKPPFGLLLFAAITIMIASAGANGLTNYLDRNLDARMERTRKRALAEGRIKPAEKVLPLIIGLTVVGLILAWFLHPLSFIADLVGTTAAVVWRKRATCVFPQGMLASCAPVVMAWFAITPAFGWEVVLLCLLVGAWLPLHVWSIMIANREDYRHAGLCYFPMSRETGESVKVLLLFALVLLFTSAALYFIGTFGWLYLVFASLAGMMMLYATIRLVVSSESQDAWKLYKLSSFPYIGIVFMAMCLDLWLL